MKYEQKRMLIYAFTFLIWAVAITLLAVTIDLKTIIQEYVIGWGTLIFINAGIAQGKGKSGITWGLLSLFLGPITTVLLVISNKENDTSYNNN